MKIITMILNNTAIHPWVNTFFISFFVYTFFSYIYKTPRPVHFHWNYILHIQNTLRFYWSNIVYAKNKKEETTHILNPYLNLSGDVFF